MSQEIKTRLNLCLPPSMVEGLEQEQAKRKEKKITTLCRLLLKERLEELNAAK